MGMQMRFDWKFILMLLVTLLGIGVPVWLWQYDLHAKSLAVRVVSSVDLHAPQASSLPGLQLTLDGIKVDAPVLTTLELLNDGSKPIPSTDFEGSFELLVAAGAKPLEAKVAAVEPTSLAATIETDLQVIRLKPLLLNPNDKITINILTSGQTPSFTPRGRIAGVSNVKFESRASSTKSIKKAFVSGPIGIAGLALYSFLGGSTRRGEKYVRMPNGVIYATAIVVALLTGLALAFTTNFLEPDSNWQTTVLFAATMGLAGVLIMHFSRKWYWSKQPA